jgi:hypothetical protein
MVDRVGVAQDAKLLEEIDGERVLARVAPATFRA